MSNYKMNMNTLWKPKKGGNNMTTIIEVKAQLKKIESAKAYVRSIQKRIDENSAALQEAKRVLEKENQDVEKLQHLSLSSIMLRFQNDKEERMAKEEKEAMDAAFHYQQLEANAQALQAELASYQELIKKESSLRAQLEDLEYEYIKTKDVNLAKEVDDLRKKMEDNRIKDKEILEAIQAGNVVNKKIEGILEKLGSAQNWGLYDMIGGGMFSSIIKHEKIGDVQRKIADIQMDIERFQKELHDVSRFEVGKLEISESLALFDMFFDNIFSDFMVQNRMQEAQTDIKNFHNELCAILDNLQQQYAMNNQMHEDLKKKSKQVVHQASTSL